MKWIFLPGMDGSGKFFEPFLKVLPVRVTPVTLAFPRAEKLGYEELFEWLLPRLPRDERFLVVAESFSGPLAVRLASIGPPGMIGAVISTSFVRNPLPRVLRRLPVEWVFRFRMPKPLVRLILADATAEPELYDLFYDAIHYSPGDVLAHRARAALQVDETEALAGCTLPLLFLQGTSDRLIHRSSTELVKRLRPDLPIVPISAPHFLLQMKPHECLQAIERFLEIPATADG